MWANGRCVPATVAVPFDAVVCYRTTRGKSTGGDATAPRLVKRESRRAVLSNHRSSLFLIGVGRSASELPGGWVGVPVVSLDAARDGTYDIHKYESVTAYTSDALVDHRFRFPNDSSQSAPRRHFGSGLSCGLRMLSTVNPVLSAWRNTAGYSASGRATARPKRTAPQSPPRRTR